ncbi:unnamed protein product [Menidia menidia]|uniref:(Atlantic silverside) hypothetical protein n=1 Tax=Menidia menidia TaxID=238744 RepID=A0A8S4B1U9_9TELE|nr:unnamed protein product [Menidia menidia]
MITQCSSPQGQSESNGVRYKRFRRRILQKGSGQGPAASTPVAPGWQCDPGFEFDNVCRRLELESPPRVQESKTKVQQGNLQEVALTVEDGSGSVVALDTPNTTQGSPVRTRGLTDMGKSPEQVEWVWRTAVEAQRNPQLTGLEEKRPDFLPFASLTTGSSGEGQSVRTLAAPSILNNYYTSLLDCSCNGMIALALGSSVYIWNSETHSLVGHLVPGPDPGRLHSNNLSISCLCWSRDGRTLCMGTRLGQVQLWDVDHKQNMRYLKSHQSGVSALSWKQHLLSSGSTLGHVHHFDLRAPSSMVGATVQRESICSLEWSPGGDQLASGSPDGLLHIWDGDVSGIKWSRQPVRTMEQPSAVKALGWCPWQRDVIATGGGWKDGELRIWNTHSGTCLTSVNTNSQICSLRWAEKRKCLVTGHGLPHCQVTSWNWEFPSLTQICQLTGHVERVLHVAINPQNTHIFSAGADQRFHIWDL